MVEVNVTEENPSYLTWLIDSGATHNITNNKTNLQDYKPFPKPMSVKVVANNSLKAYGSGTAFPQVFDRTLQFKLSTTGSVIRAHNAL